MGSSGKGTEFGHVFKSQFLFRPGYTNLNHGSFGTYPLSIRNTLREYQELAEEVPDQFMRYDFVHFLNESRNRIAQLLHVSPMECVFVQNATTGVNTVLRNLQYNDKDCIIYFDTIYGACEKTLFSIVETNPQLHLRKIRYLLPCAHSEIIDAVKQTIDQVLAEGLVPKVCVFDTITSVPAVRLPFESITNICKEHGIMSVIDGAHGVGQIALNLGEFSPDFFVSNCHKWLYTPRGCAVLYIPKRHQHLIRTTYPTSWGWAPIDSSPPRNPKKDIESSYFVNMFSYVGTADNCPYYCVPAAIDFRQNECGGEENIYNYIRAIAQQGADLLAKILGTKVMDIVDTSSEVNNGRRSCGLRDCAMANVLLPITIIDHDSNLQLTDPVIIQEKDIHTHVAWINKTLVKEYNVGTSIYAYNRSIWVRVSGQIYLELRDFEWFGGVVKEVLERVRSGESLKEKED
ncbi:uncharacterized protein Z518_06121 [Rhinocladiella mackenziei CBS 650.93]|uniref:Aminotransferase class V domain-containing protein n=1 Tax=Rhinocladiella mackenziei CBS 650.93 TaxID=1442369 RepID=A0A0D2IHI1_9EURO|nr:uncharacterized protein Z518_06121 [Rhinocladiella mackenziei CBS 650.93]KIX05249.1 hypothetical protein Z518_06121 [Rhinocladiella mackenziei CBS 650.93]